MEYNNITNVMSVNSDKLSFTLENLVQGVPNPCGGYKCFYRVKHTYRDKHVGYVVGGKPFMKETMWEAYNYSLQLEEKYGIQHTALKPPETIKLGPRFWRSQRSRRLIAFLDSHSTLRRKFNGWSELYIQLVENILMQDNPALFWGFHSSKQREAEKGMDRFVDYLKGQNQTVRSAFADNLRRNAEQLHIILQENFCISHDFQVVIQNTGNIVHFDVDRCFNKAKKKDPYTYRYEGRPADYPDQVQQAFTLLVKRLCDAVLP